MKQRFKKKPRFKDTQNLVAQLNADLNCVQPFKNNWVAVNSLLIKLVNTQIDEEVFKLDFAQESCLAVLKHIPKESLLNEARKEVQWLKIAQFMYKHKRIKRIPEYTSLNELGPATENGEPVQIHCSCDRTFNLWRAYLAPVEIAVCAQCNEAHLITTQTRSLDWDEPNSDSPYASVSSLGKATQSSIKGWKSFNPEVLIYEI